MLGWSVNQSLRSIAYCLYGVIILLYLSVIGIIVGEMLVVFVLVPGYTLAIYKMKITDKFTLYLLV